MASSHLSVKTIKRSAGRSVTGAAACRAGERIECQREGRVHDYTRKQGIEETFIVAPTHAPAWAQDRSALWNAAEASETRVNSVTGREWELALPSEVSAAERSAIVRDFAQELVGRYGVAVDVAIRAPHREGTGAAGWVGSGCATRGAVWSEPGAGAVARGLGKDRGAKRDAGAEDRDRPPIRERLDAVLDKPRERLEVEDEREVGQEQERDKDEREGRREVDRDSGLSH